MFKRKMLLPGLLYFSGWMLSTLGAFGQDQGSAVDFATDIRPIFETQCLRCHGPEEEEGGFRIDDREQSMEYIEAGDAEGSDFYEHLISEEEDVMMPPPDEGGPLNQAEVHLVKAWIDGGADWPQNIQLRAPVAVDESEPSMEDLDNGVATARNVASQPDQQADELPANADDELTDDALPAVIERQQPSIWRAVGTLHPAAIHLPMGLLLAAGLFALLSLRGNFVMSDCAYYCLWLGTLGAIIGCVTGWGFTMIEYPKEAPAAFEDLTNMDHKLFWHRSSAIVMTVFALLLALFAASARNRDPDDGVAWKLGLILLAGGIGYVGHQGGKLTWKASHYNDLEAVVREYIPGLFGDDNVKPKEMAPSPDEQETDDEPASGESSTEDADQTTSIDEMTQSHRPATQLPT